MLIVSWCDRETNCSSERSSGSAFAASASGRVRAASAPGGPASTSSDGSSLSRACAVSVVTSSQRYVHTSMTLLSSLLSVWMRLGSATSGTGVASSLTAMARGAIQAARSSVKGWGREQLGREGALLAGLRLHGAAGARPN
eukprot:5104816-Prymnesium_polylepis.1